ncbi:MAG TPA: hypothetical protein DDZ51_19810 [Planctomycetaceae bacterium]|nr:hypothetical protein [Planctomycetaceae bacterium]
MPGVERLVSWPAGISKKRLFRGREQARRSQRIGHFVANFLTVEAVLLGAESAIVSERFSGTTFPKWLDG